MNKQRKSDVDFTSVANIIKGSILKIFSSPSNIVNMAKTLFKGFSISVCLFVIYRKYVSSFSAEKYSKWFSGFSFNVPSGIPLIGIKGYSSWSSSYFVIGAGITSPGDMKGSISKSYYFDITKQVIRYISFLNSMMTSIKRLAGNVK